jgi:hypothetical protein
LDVYIGPSWNSIYIKPAWRCYCTYGAALFAAKRVNIEKFLLSVGTSQGLFTIAFHVASEISSGRLLAIGNNYIVWLTSSVAGLEILFAVIAQSISKGKGDSFVSRAKICIKKE